MTDVTVHDHEPQIVHVPVKQVRESPYNRRRSWGDLKGLAASIERHGVIQPLVARQVDGRAGVELVAGARRLRAAAEAGLDLVPVVVREYSDTEAQEALLEENLEREDLHPMDEAEAFETLQRDHGYSVEDLAERFGKTTTHVRQRLKLTALIKPVRKLYLEGKVQDRAAFAIARLADPKAQERALEMAKDRFLAGDVDDDDWDWRDFTRILREEMPDLASAPFSIEDVSLVPEAGACTSCPKRTGVQRELFAELAKKEDLCLDRACWQKKCDVEWKRVTADAKKTGAKVISGKEAQGMFGWNGRLPYGSKYVETDKELGDITGTTSRKKLRTALKKNEPPTILARDQDGNIHRLYERKEAMKKLKEEGLVTKATAESRASRADPAAERIKREQAIRRRTFAIAMEHGVTAAAHAEPGPLCAAIALALSSGLPAQGTVERLGLAVDKDGKKKKLDTYSAGQVLEKEIAWLPVTQLAGVALELALREASYGSQDLGPLAKKALAALGVDVKACEKAAREQLKAEEKAKKERAKKKAAASKKKGGTKKTNAKRSTKR